MLKKVITPALLLCVLMNTSCEKEDLASVKSSDAVVESNVQPEGGGMLRLGTAINIDNPATYKGMYVDGANTIIGNTTKENALIAYAASKGINTLAFYRLKNVI